MNNLFFVLSLIALSFFSRHQPWWRWLVRDHQIIEIKLGDSPWLEVEVVKKPASIEQGLSQRSQLKTDGMLFLLPVVEKHSFWMKDMQFALDLIWLSHGQVKQIETQLPPVHQELPREEIPIYQAAQPVNLVLEVGVGQAESWGIAVGDSLRVKPSLQFKPSLSFKGWL